MAANNVDRRSFSVPDLFDDVSLSDLSSTATAASSSSTGGLGEVLFALSATLGAPCVPDEDFLFAAKYAIVDASLSCALALT